MPIDFRKMVADLDAARKAEKAEAQKATEEERRKRSDFVDVAVRLLIEKVVPVLKEAVRGFAVRGIEARIGEDFDVKSAKILCPRSGSGAMDRSAHQTVTK
jgi:hypothetical protein